MPPTRWPPRPEFWRAEARLAALERLRFGVTTGRLAARAAATASCARTSQSTATRIAKAFARSGTRSVVAIGPTRPPHPRTYARSERSDEARISRHFRAQIATCHTLIDTWHGTHGDRLNIALLTPTLRPEHREELGAANARESRRARPSRRRAQPASAASSSRRTATQGQRRLRAANIGILGPNALLSHSTGLTDGGDPHLRRHRHEHRA